MELLLSGKPFDDYIIGPVLSNKYIYRTVYRVRSDDYDSAVMIIYDMNAYKGPCTNLFGMKVPVEFYYANILQKVVSPEVYDMGENHRHGNLCWMCQEFIHGFDLSFFAAFPLTEIWPEKKALAMSLSNRYLHFTRLLPGCSHANLSINNFLVSIDEKGRKIPVMIGLSHVVDMNESAAPHPENTRSMIYNAPESLSGRYAPNSDVYSMAMIIYELLTGDRPWRFSKWHLESSFQKSRATLNALRREPPHLVAVPKVLQEVLGKALSDRKKRFANYEEFNESLAKSLKKATRPVPRIEESDETDEPDDDAEEPEKDGYPRFNFNDEGHPQSKAEIEKMEGPGFQAVAGMEPLKENLTHNFIDVLRYADIARTYGIQPPNGMLFYGPPGCGKTYLASRLAEEVGINVSFVRPSDLGSTYIHGSQSMIADLFQKAEKSAPTLLVFDEIDALVPSRSKVDNVSLSSETNEFLSQMENCSQRGIYVVGTTNRIEQIDPAILRSGRIEELVYIPLPDRTNRLALFQMELKDRPCAPDLDYDRLVDLTEHFTMSDVSYAIKKASRKAFDLAVEMKEGGRSVIDMAMLEQAIAETIPSVDIKAEREYERQRQSYENRHARASLSTIGFRTNN